MSNCQLYEDIEDLIYEHTNKNTLNFIEYEKFIFIFNFCLIFLSK